MGRATSEYGYFVADWLAGGGDAGGAHVLWTWNDFLIPLVMSPSGTMRTAPLGLAFFQGSTQGSTLLAAGAVLVALPMVILYFICNDIHVGMTDEQSRLTAAPRFALGAELCERPRRYGPDIFFQSDKKGAAM